MSYNQLHEGRWRRPARHRRDRRTDVLVVTLFMAGAIGGLLGFVAL